MLLASVRCSGSGLPPAAAVPDLPAGPGVNLLASRPHPLPSSRANAASYRYPAADQQATVCTASRLTPSGRTSPSASVFTASQRAAWTLSTPLAVPNMRNEREDLTLTRLGARLTVEHLGRCVVLDVPAVRFLRELIEALGRYDCEPVHLGAS